MESFQTLEATCLPFFKDDIDTDQIIPARFLTGTSKTGLGSKLFYDWRYDEQGNINPDSIFDSSRYAGSQILVGGNNFGCGSSREHAPWSLKDFGFRAIIAVSFADIFHNNSLKNFLLPVALPEDVVQALVRQVEGNPALRVSIDLERQLVTIPNQGEYSFEINSFRKKCLLEGLDDVAYVLSYLPQIEAFEGSRQPVTC
jgi:3-isopropylmalate/(R)-2-methylmalate dehydratase small subunit